MVHTPDVNAREREREALTLIQMIRYIMKAKLTSLWEVGSWQYNVTKSTAYIIHVLCENMLT
jgi:hypothetical protein